MRNRPVLSHLVLRNERGKPTDRSGPDQRENDPYGDPRIAALYDEDNAPGADHDFFRGVVERSGARTVVDLGCGTGLLTVTYTTDGRDVYGIDPSATMLAIACERPGGDRVRWHLGDATALAPMLDAGTVDAVTMTGNVAQAIRGDAWSQTLTAISTALRPGGVVAFESRNPAARGWKAWDRASTLSSRDTPFGPLTEWMEVTEVREDGDGGPTVSFAAHNIWVASGEHQIIEDTLQFRTPETLTADLAAAGLTVTSLDGGWHGEPVTADARVLVVTASR